MYLYSNNCDEVRQVYITGLSKPDRETNHCSAKSTYIYTETVAGEVKSTTPRTTMTIVSHCSGDARRDKGTTFNIIIEF